MAQDFLYRVFRNVIVTPLTAGNLFHGQDCRDTDGSLSSIVGVAFFTAVTFVLLGVSIHVPNHYVLWIVTLCLSSIATVSIVLMSVLAYKKKEEWLHTRQDQTQRTMDVKIKFLWLFGFGVMFSTATAMAINIECLQTDSTSFYTGTFTIAHFVYIVFCCVQIGFITYFKDYKLGSTVRINYGILLLLLTNLIMWFQTVVGDGDGYFAKPNISINAHATTEEICFWNSTIQVFRDKLGPYLHPVNVEFFFIGAGFILSMWAPFKDDESTENCLHTFPETDERSPLLYRTENTNSPRYHPASYFFALTYGIALNASVVTMVILKHCVHYDEDSMEYWLDVIMLLYKISMLCMTFYIFHFFCKNGKRTKENKQLSASECILIFAYTGVAAWSTFAFVAGIYTKPIGKYVYLLDQVITFVASFFQTIMVIKSSRIHIRRRQSVGYVCFLLAVSNFMMWCTESFVFVSVNPKVVDNDTFFNERTWSYLIHLLLPVIIFYRFHSFVDLFAIRSRLVQEEENEDE